MRQAARLSFSRATPDREGGTLAAAIPDRQTTRLPFGSERVPSTTLQHLVDQAAQHGSHLAFVSGEDIHRVAELTFMGTALNLADSAVYRGFTDGCGLVRTTPGIAATV